MRFIPVVVLTSLLCLTMVVGCGKSPRTVEEPPAAKEPVAPSGKAVIGPKGQGAGRPQARNIIVLTERAAARIKTIMQARKDPLVLRVRVVGGDYKLDLDTDASPENDIFGQSRGVRVVVDRESALSIPDGTVVDYLGDPGGFKVSAPEGFLGSPDTSVTLAEARKGFKTKLTRRSQPGSAAPEPPAGVFRLVRYDSPAGKLAAYLTPDPMDGKKHPAIVWITGGDCNSIDEGCWKEGPADNDQSASAYRKAGIVMMFPSLRGGNDNPGPKEGFLGEVDDVLAAAEFLASQPFVDPQRIYLGGHSTGGTLVLLVSECSDRFRAIFSFGPADDVLNYGPRYNPFALSDRKEVRLRAPRLWLHSIRSPTFVFEGTAQGNLDSLRTMARSSKNPKVQFIEVKGANHFNLLAPTNRLIAQKILGDTGPTSSLAFTEEEVSKPFGK
jgi:Fe-S cluster assembly iron-binding protein IscA